MNRERYRGRSTRWVPAVAAVFAMAFVSVYQYSWALFLTPLSKVFDMPASSALLGLTYTIYNVVQAISMWLAGRYADTHGPRNISMVAGILAGVGYVACGFAPNISLLYLTYGIGGIGVGIIYATAISTAIKWFPDIRGTVSGLIVLGFGGGSFALSPLIDYIIVSSNYRNAFLYIGIVQVIVVTTASYTLVYPPAGWKPAGWSPEEAEKKRRLVRRNDYEFTLKEMTHTWQWIVIYVSFILISGAGLSIIGHLIPYGQELGFTVVALVSLYLFPFADGVGRLVSGTISDLVGRPHSMLLFYCVSGISMLVLSFNLNPAAFVLLIIITAFTWGSLFSLFPSMVGDYFGSKNSGSNYGFTYTAKAIGGVFAGYGASLMLSRIGVSETLIVAGVMAIIAGLLATTLKLPQPPK